MYLKKRMKIKKAYSLLRLPSLTLYVRLWNARSTGGRVGRCCNLFGCAGTMCALCSPTSLTGLLVVNRFILTLSSLTIFLLQQKITTATKQKLKQKKKLLIRILKSKLTQKHAISSKIFLSLFHCCFVRD